MQPQTMSQDTQDDHHCIEEVAMRMRDDHQHHKEDNNNGQSNTENGRSRGSIMLKTGLNDEQLVICAPR
jgi:hypothetical protein